MVDGWKFQLHVYHSCYPHKHTLRVIEIASNHFQSIYVFYTVLVFILHISAHTYLHWYSLFTTINIYTSICSTNLVAYPKSVGSRSVGSPKNPKSFFHFISFFRDLTTISSTSFRVFEHSVGPFRQLKHARSGVTRMFQQRVWWATWFHPYWQRSTWASPWTPPDFPTCCNFCPLNRFRFDSIIYRINWFYCLDGCKLGQTQSYRYGTSKFSSLHSAYTPRRILAAQIWTASIYITSLLI